MWPDWRSKLVWSLPVIGVGAINKKKSKVRMAFADNASGTANV